MALTFRKCFLIHKRFYQYLNSFIPTIKFTINGVFKRANKTFLDVNISEKESALQTYIVSQQILTSSYILDLVHLYVYKKSTPYGQAIQMKRICSNEERLSSRLEFCSRHYKERNGS